MSEQQTQGASGQPTKKGQIREVRIDRIRRDSGAQFRPSLNAAHVNNLVQVVNYGASLNPIILFDDRKELWLADGDHRIEATQFLGLATIRAEVFEGTREDAIVYGAGANTEETLPRSRDTKRAQVKWLLLNRPNMGISGIARHAKVGRPLVYQVIEDDPELKLSCNLLQDSEGRIVERGGKEYTMKTANIGAHLRQNDTQSEDYAAENLPLAQALAKYKHKGRIFIKQVEVFHEQQNTVKAARRAFSMIPNLDGPVSNAIKQIASIPDPSQWEGCPTCKGSLRVGKNADPCPDCKGGFTVCVGAGVSATVVSQFAENFSKE